jgi:hypothetical protein
LLLLAVRRLGLFLQVGQALVLEEAAALSVVRQVLVVELVALAQRTITTMVRPSTSLAVAVVVELLLAVLVVLAAIGVAVLVVMVRHHQEMSLQGLAVLVPQTRVVEAAAEETQSRLIQPLVVRAVLVVLVLLSLVSLMLNSRCRNGKLC